MRVRFWGVRGFYPTPGEEFSKYGGNTAAYEVTSDAGETLLVDVGTGAVALGRALMAGDLGQGMGQLPILLTDTHLDHTGGLPFFTPAFVAGNRLDLYGAGPKGLRQVLDALFDPHVCPISNLDNLAASVGIHDVPEGSIEIADFTVTGRRVPHGRDTGVGWRIEADGKVLAVLTAVDHPDGPLAESVLAIARGADLLIHIASWRDPDEWSSRWGGAASHKALAVAHGAQAKRLCLSHYGPRTTDARLEEMVQRLGAVAHIPVVASREGEEIEL